MRRIRITPFLIYVALALAFNQLSCQNDVIRPDLGEFPSGNVLGTVSWPAGPLANAHVVADNGLRTTQTNAAGLFALRLDPGVHRITVAAAAPDSTGAHSISMEIDVPNEGRADIEFRFARIIAEIAIPDTLANVTFTLAVARNGGALASYDVIADSTTVALESPPLAPGRYHIELHSDHPTFSSLASFSEELTELQERRLTFNLNSLEGNVRGRVRWPGGPLADARVYNNDVDVRTDAFGRFAFQAEPGDRGYLVLNPPTERYFSPPYVARVPVPDTGFVNVDVRFARLTVDFMVPPELEDSLIALSDPETYHRFTAAEGVVHDGRATLEFGPMAPTQYPFHLFVGSDPNPHKLPYEVPRVYGLDDVRIAYELPAPARLDIDFGQVEENFIPETTELTIGTHQLRPRTADDGVRRIWSATSYAPPLEGKLRLGGTDLLDGESLTIESGQHIERAVALSGFRIDVRVPPHANPGECYISIQGPAGSLPGRGADKTILFLNPPLANYTLHAGSARQQTWFAQYYPGTQRLDEATVFSISSPTDRHIVEFDIVDGSSVWCPVRFSEPGPDLSRNSISRLEYPDGLVARWDAGYSSVLYFYETPPGRFRLALQQESGGPVIYYPGAWDPEDAELIETPSGGEITLPEFILHRPFLPNAGACCLDDETCAWLDRESCRLRGGMFMGMGVRCGSVPCGEPTFACCMPTGECFRTSQEDCRAQGGEPFADEVCYPSPCRPLGPCCFEDTCEVMRPMACELLGGEILPNGFTCNPAPCREPVGACCDGQVCAITRRSLCLSVDRLHYVGDFTFCEPNSCP